MNDTTRTSDRVKKAGDTSVWWSVGATFCFVFATLFISMGQQVVGFVSIGIGIAVLVIAIVMLVRWARMRSARA